LPNATILHTDHLGDRMPGEVLPGVLELEWEAGSREPYRSVARLIHLVGRKKPTQG
jgi:S-adenosylmethionine-dependent methyltransferase